MLASVSRLVGEVASREVRGAGDEVRRLMAAYRDKEDLIAIGAYQQGTDPLTDAAIAARTPVEQFLRQRVDDPSSAEAPPTRRWSASPPTASWSARRTPASWRPRVRGRRERGGGAARRGDPVAQPRGVASAR